jgi:pimeloyl-ACP methyl ester carboxylesterase
MSHDLAELTYLQDAASEHGIASDGLTITRQQTTTRLGQVSALRYAEANTPDPPRLALLHGGGQNAHTWDLTVAALRLPALAVDLPGHGSSDWLPDHDYSPRRLTQSVATALAVLCPDVEVLVGMSLGGMVALTVAGTLPRLRHIVLVDVSPGSALPAGSSVQEIRRHPEAPFETFVDIVARTSPQRPRGALRHAVWHSTRPVVGGRVWRIDPDIHVGSFVDLWPALTDLAEQVTEILADHGSFVPDDDRARLRELIGARLLLVEGSTHSVQNTRPAQLAAILREVMAK